MAVTPLIRPIPVSGGVFYTMSSAQEDIGTTFNSSVTKFRFSKFALLNIPNIANPAFADNKIQFRAIDGHMLHGLDSDNNVNLAESFQSYCLNLEASLISRSEYDRTLKKTVSERVFFRWLKELGAVRFADANSTQSTLNTVTDPRFVEETEVLTGSERYYRVVQYVGDIDIVNSVQNNTNAYSEVYVHVPTSDGNTPLVLFKSEADANYDEDMNVRNLPTDPLDAETVYGRHYTDTHPAGLTIDAFFDQDTLGSPSSLFWDGSGYTISENWYDPNVGPNAYFTEETFGDSSNDKIRKTEGLNTLDYVRTRLDGIGIDFDPDSYKPIVDDPTISTLTEYSSTVTSADFEFNAVLIYYDVYDPADPDNAETNLYGVLFLENVEQLSTEYGIPRLEKIRPNPITKLNGNSYAFKLNFKFDTSADQAGITERAVNDYSTFSMELFIDTMNILQQATTILTDQVTEIQELKTKVLELEDLIINTDQYEEMQLRIDEIQESLEANSALLENTSSIMGLFNNLSAQFTALVNGQTTISVAYNLDAIKQGDGVIVDKSTPNKVKVSNSVQAYTITAAEPYQGDVVLGTAIKLQPFSNYYRHYADGLQQTATGDLQIKIDDTTNRWQLGQTFRIAFEDVLDMSTFSIIVVTDAPDRLGIGPYGRIVGVLSGTQFDAADDRPIFDITCVNATTLAFVVDQIR